MHGEDKKSRTKNNTDLTTAVVPFDTFDNEFGNESRNAKNESARTDRPHFYYLASIS